MEKNKFHGLRYNFIVDKVYPLDSFDKDISACINADEKMKYLSKIEIDKV